MVFSSESALCKGDRSIGASASVLPMNTQGLSPLRLTGSFSLQSTGLSRVSSIQHHNSEAPFLQCSGFFMVQLSHSYDFPVAQMVKCLPTRQETRVQSLGREDLLEEEMATHSNILAWEISWTEEPGRLQYMGTQKSQT